MSAQYVPFDDAQGPQSIFVNESTKRNLEQNASTLRDYLQHRRSALLQWNSLDPAELQPVTLRVLNNGVRELTVNGKYRILHDNPAYLGGYNTGMTARENLLGVLATCITHITEGQAALLNVTLDSLALEVTGKWDPRGGRPGFEQVPQYPTDIHYTLHVKTPEREACIEELLAAVEKICPMYNLFIDAPQTFEAKIVRVGRKK